MLLSFAVFLLLLLLGMPVVFAIGIGGLVFFLTQPGLQLTMPVQLALAETQNFSLLAIPTFILASNLMNELGVTRRLLRFAHVATGFMRGGLAQGQRANPRLKERPPMRPQQRSRPLQGQSLGAHAACLLS